MNATEIILPCDNLNITCLECGYKCTKIDFSKYSNQGLHLQLKPICPRCKKHNNLLDEGVCLNCWEAEKLPFK